MNQNNDSVKSKRVSSVHKSKGLYSKYGVKNNLQSSVIRNNRGSFLSKIFKFSLVLMVLFVIVAVGYQMIKRFGVAKLLESKIIVDRLDYKVTYTNSEVIKDWLNSVSEKNASAVRVLLMNQCSSIVKDYGNIISYVPVITRSENWKEACEAVKNKKLSTVTILNKYFNAYVITDNINELAGASVDAVAKQEFKKITSYDLDEESNINRLSYNLGAYSTFVVDGSRTSKSSYKYPLYSKPRNLISFDPKLFNVDYSHSVGSMLDRGDPITGRISKGKFLSFFNRYDISYRRILKPLNQEIVWLSSPVDEYMAQYYGKAIVRYTDGSEITLVKDGDNGLISSYYDVKRSLAKLGNVDISSVNYTYLSDLFIKSPSSVYSKILQNNHYSFFKERDINSDSLSEVIGVTAAVNTMYIPLGTPVLTKYNTDDGIIAFKLLYPNRELDMLNEGNNTARKIKFYAGRDTEAMQMDNKFKVQSEVYIFLPKTGNTEIEDEKQYQYTISDIKKIIRDTSVYSGTDIVGNSKKEGPETKANTAAAKPAEAAAKPAESDKASQ